MLRTSHPSDWLTDERVQEVIHNVQTVVSQETKNRDDRSDAVKVIRNVISEAQHAMDLAFVAGTIATSTGIARSDSVRYAERLNDEDAKTAIDDAKIYLKKNNREG